MENGYEDIVKTFNGIPCTFRHHLDTDVIEIKVDDNFAKCNGYNSLDSWINSVQSLKRTINKHFNGKIPEWVIVTDNGEFIAVDKSKLN